MRSLIRSLWQACRTRQPCPSRLPWLFGRLSFPHSNASPWNESANDLGDELLQRQDLAEPDSDSLAGSRAPQTGLSVFRARRRRYWSPKELARLERSLERLEALERENVALKKRESRAHDRPDKCEVACRSALTGTPPGVALVLPPSPLEPLQSRRGRAGAGRQAG
jgi:hypothetical protein